MSWDPATCQAIDTETAAHAETLNRARHAFAGTVDTVHAIAGNRADRSGRRPKYLTVEQALELAATEEAAGRSRYAVRIAELAERIAAQREAIAAAQAAYDASEARYAGWPRFFLVTSSTGGHVHSSLDCSTCYATTTYGWLPQLSGLTEADAVADQGSRLCTVCYPSAPSDWTDGSRLGREAQAAADAKAAAKAERQAKAAAKAITSPDGSPLRIRRFGDRETISTLAAAKSRATDMAEDLVDSYLLANRPELVAEAGVALGVLAEAIAHKLGTTAEAERAAAVKRAAARRR